jgi:uncharacterized protein YbjT (DUF2867 family)
MNYKKALITGATGFTGSHTVTEFAGKGYTTDVFVRNKDKALALKLDKFAQIRTGSLENVDSLKAALADKDVLVNITSLGFGHAPSIVEACRSVGVERAVFISTTGIFTKLNPSSKKIRIEAEGLIKESGLKYTILRPTMIFGTLKDRNICRLIRYIKKYPVLFIPGSGKNLIQPVYVKDLARAIRLVVESKNTLFKEYTVSGRDVVSFNGLVDSIGELLGRKTIKVHLPLSLAAVPLSIVEKTGLTLPIKTEQILRLNEDKAFTYEEAKKDFGYFPTALKDALGNEIEEIFRCG